MTKASFDLRGLSVVFMGTPDFAVPSLEVLYALGCDVRGVFTQPTRPKGRGRKVAPPPVARTAEAHGTPVFQWPRLTHASYAALCELEPELVVVAAYGRILPARYLDFPRLGCVNVHASVLPRWRGAAPIQWSVIAGDAETGVSIMQMDLGMDTGDVGLVSRTPIGPDETAGELHERLAVIGAAALADALRAMAAGRLVFESQIHEQATMAPMLQKTDGRLDWTRPADAVRNHVRGMHPWPGAFAVRAEGPLKVHAVRLAAGSGEAGRIIAHDPDGPRVACGHGAVTLLRAQRPGRKAVSGADLLRGGPALEVGQPIEDL